MRRLTAPKFGRMTLDIETVNRSSSRNRIASRLELTESVYSILASRKPV